MAKRIFTAVDLAELLLPPAPAPPEDARLARLIGKQIDAAGILCPNRQERSHTDQPLATEGDWEEHLFCPHCDLAVVITVRANRRERK